VLDDGHRGREDLDFSSMALKADGQERDGDIEFSSPNKKKRESARRTRDRTERIDSDDDEGDENDNDEEAVRGDQAAKGLYKGNNDDQAANENKYPKETSKKSAKTARKNDVRSICGYIHYYITRKMHIDLTSGLVYDLFSKSLIFFGALALQFLGNDCGDDNLWPHLVYIGVMVNFAVSNFTVLRWYNRVEEIKINLIGFYYVWFMMLIVETSHYLALCYIISNMQCDLLLDWLPMFMTYLLNILWRGITYVDYIKQNSYHKFLESYIPWNKKSGHEGLSFLFLLIYMIVTLILTTDCPSTVCTALYYCLLVELAMSGINICCLKNFFYLDR